MAAIYFLKGLLPPVVILISIGVTTTVGSVIARGSPLVIARASRASDKAISDRRGLTEASRQGLLRSPLDTL